MIVDHHIQQLHPMHLVDLVISIVLQGRIRTTPGRNMTLQILTTASSIHLTIHLEVLLEVNRHEHEDVLVASVVTINLRLHLETTAIEMKDLNSIVERDPSTPTTIDSMTLLSVDIPSSDTSHFVDVGG